MSDGNIRQVLAGRKALVVGIASDQSIAYGALDRLRQADGPGWRLAELPVPTSPASLASRVTGGTVYVDGGANIVA